MKKVLLSIAGYDPTSGAGILLDIRRFMQMGFHGTGIVTALTAQNTQCLEDIHVPPSSFLAMQYRQLKDDMKISGIKVGMLGSRQNIPEVAKILSENAEKPLVVDPIMRSSSGFWLLGKANISAYTDSIGPRASLLTPNIHEAEILSGFEIRNITDMKKAAEKISHRITAPCLIKGGHLKNDPTDVLYDGQKHTLFKSDKIEKSVHGTGCFLSSSILGYLVMGQTLQNACKRGIQDTAEAIKRAEPIGFGQHIIRITQ
jgi:hydroxymethylpyrimidine/phosphomethylpyrimidine kinase